MTMNTPEELGALVRATFVGETGEFRPCAVFDRALDCIRVITADTSVTEIRVNDLLTVLEDNYPNSNSRKYVGFTIKGARHFCQQRSFNLTIPIKLTELLDAILASTPDPFVRVVIDGIARPLVEEKKIEPVSLSGPVPRAA